MRRASANAATSVAALSRPMPGNCFNSSTVASASALSEPNFCNKFCADLHDVRAFQTRAQQNRDQLRVGQRVRPARHEPFARPFVRRLVFEPQTF